MSEDAMNTRPGGVRPAISVVIPAYNEAADIAAVVAGVRAVVAPEDQVIVVDDGSTDGTGELAREAGATVIRHAYNVGNGASLKSGIRAARGQDIVLMDGDGQHNPEDIPRLVADLAQYHMVVGARTAESESDLHRDWANRIFNGLATYLAGRRIEDLTSGFRALRGRVAKQFACLLPNRFSSPTTLTLGLVRAGYQLAYRPIAVTRRNGDSHIQPVPDAIRFVIIMLKITTLFAPLRVFLPISATFMTCGVGYYLYTFLTAHRFTNMSMLLISTAVLTFLLGMVSDQIAQIRLERSAEDHMDV